MAITKPVQVMRTAGRQTMTDQVSLSRKQRLAIAALMSAKTIADAAKAAGVSERQVYRWLADDDAFRDALTQAEGQAIDDATRTLIADLRHVHDVMRSIMDDDDSSAGVRLRAAATLDASLLRWRELRNIEDRLGRLERIAQYGRR